MRSVDVTKEQIQTSKNTLPKKDLETKSSFSDLLKNIDSKDTKSLEFNPKQIKTSDTDKIKDQKTDQNLESLLKNIKTPNKNITDTKAQPTKDNSAIKNLATLLQNSDTKKTQTTPKNITDTKAQPTKDNSANNITNNSQSIKNLANLLQDSETSVPVTSKDISKNPKSIKNLEDLLKNISITDTDTTLPEITKNENPIEGLLKTFNNDQLIQPKEVKTLSNQEVKLLISDAKTYLKQKIINNDENSKLNSKELPKTLKGLDKFAKKLGINTQKITLQEVQDVNQQLKEQALKTPKNLKITDKLQKTPEKNEKTEPLGELLKVFDKKENLQIDGSKNISKTANKIKDLNEIQSPTIKSTKNGSKKDIKSKNVEIEKSKILDTPKLTTQVSQASVPISDATQKLEALLKSKKEGNKTSEDTNHLQKNDTVTSSQKVDSLDTKISEAKQMVKYLSSDVKNAIDDYKSPFTRIKVQLNPQKLGDVDLTVVQRGKNLHVNISSNNNAINTLSMNINELRVQLSNSGINNASINFNNSDQSFSSTNSGQEHNRQNNQENAKREYNYFDNDEKNEEILSSVEIIIPNYA